MVLRGADQQRLAVDGSDSRDGEDVVAIELRRADGSCRCAANEFAETLMTSMWLLRIVCHRLTVSPRAVVTRRASCVVFVARCRRVLLHCHAPAPVATAGSSAGTRRAAGTASCRSTSGGLGSQRSSRISAKWPRLFDLPIVSPGATQRAGVTCGNLYAVYSCIGCTDADSLLRTDIGIVLTNS